jgi:hypothetical protein
MMARKSKMGALGSYVMSQPEELSVVEFSKTKYGAPLTILNNSDAKIGSVHGR